MTDTSTTYYIFQFQSKTAENRERAQKAGPPFLIDWKEMVMKKTGKGESRQIFDRPVAWLGKIDMHATTLNAGEVSHPPHIHRAEEIILMRSGNVQMYIDGKYHKASAGDLVYLSSGVPHALENKSNERCEYLPFSGYHKLYLPRVAHWNIGGSFNCPAYNRSTLRA